MRPAGLSVAVAEKAYMKARHTGDDLRALEVLIGVQVARREGKVDAHQDQQEIDSPPHDVGSRGAPFEGLVGLRISVLWVCFQKRVF
jgi:hypothetical protein